MRSKYLVTVTVRCAPVNGSVVGDTWEYSEIVEDRGPTFPEGSAIPGSLWLRARRAIETLVRGA